MTEQEFTIVREFDAPRAAIWQAWTDPTIAARWWHPHGLTTPPESVSIDLREGGRYAYTMALAETGESWPTGGTYLAVREPEHLRFTWARPDNPADESPVLTVDLRELSAGRTEMTFHVRGLADDRPDERGVYSGWSEAFAELDQNVAVGR